MRKTTLFLFVVILLFVTTAFDCGSNNREGFYLHTRLGIFSMGIPVKIVHPDVVIFGTWEADLYGLATGSVTQLPSFARTDGNGYYPVGDGRAPAQWRFGEFSGPCTNLSFSDRVNLGQDYEIVCDTTCFFISGPNCPHGTFGADPSFLNVDDPPATVRVTGADIVTTYGMPQIFFYDQSGTMVAQAQASEVATDGTWMSATTPDLTNIYPNSYWMIVKNVAADGSLQHLGAAIVFIGSPYVPPPPPPPEPCPDSQPGQPPPVCDGIY